MLLSVLVPTINRSASLKKNLMMLNDYIFKMDLQSEIEIIVSDNASDSLEHESNMKAINMLGNHVSYYYQPYNIGYENNILFLLDKSISEYVMFLGDDDYLSLDLFSLIIHYVKESRFSCIVCNYFVIDESGNVISDANRDSIEKDRVHYKNDYAFALKGHQLSCLTFKKKGVLEYYTSRCISNLYPTITFIGYCISYGDGIHITRYPYANTQLKKKNFDYSFDNLLEDLCISVENIPFCDDYARYSTYDILLHNERDRFVNRNTFFHPLKFLRRVKNNYKIGSDLKRKILYKFLVEWFKLPLRYIFSHK